MTKATFASLPPVANIQQAIEVFPFALLALAHVLTTSMRYFPLKIAPHSLTACLCLLWGICFRDKHQNPSGISRALGSISHDRLQRLLSNQATNATVVMLQLLQQAISLATITPICFSWLVLDDVWIPKPFARHIQGVYWDHDHTFNREGYGIRVVGLLWTNGIIAIPVAFLVWHKRQSPMPPFAPRRYRSKNQLARLLVYKVVRKGLRFDVLVFDNWYAGADNLLLFNRLGLTWVTAIAINRILRIPLPKPIRHRHGRPTTHEKISVQQWAACFPYRSQYTPYPSVDLRAKHLKGKLFSNLPEVMLVVVKDYAKSRSFQQELELLPPQCLPKDPNKYLLTNALQATVPWVIRCYQNRWAVEVLFRTLKQQCALGACQARKFEKVTRHIAFSLLGYVCLQQLHVLLETNGKVAKEATLGDVRRWLQDAYAVKTSGGWHFIRLSHSTLNVDAMLQGDVSFVSFAGDTASDDTAFPFPLQLLSMESTA